MTNDQPWWLTWPPEEVAAAIMPLFSSSSHTEERDAMSRIVSWFRTGSPTSAKFPTRWGGGFCAEFDDPDYRAAAEAMQVLESTRLLVRAMVVSDYSYCNVGLTRQGMHALQTNTVRQHLGLGDAPPAA
jgi:hypothetical protein